MAVQPVIMPKLGVYTEDVLLVEWKAGEGDEVIAGAVVLEMETDKTTADVEAEASGWLHRTVAAGTSVPIGTQVGLIAETREEYEALLLRSASTGDVEVVAQEVPASNGGAARDVTSPRPKAPGVGAPVSPRARALLSRLGIPIEEARAIAGTGPGGRVTDRDVTAWAETRSRAAPASDGLTVARSIPLKGRRGVIAEKMTSSLQTAAQLTSILELDVKPLLDLRAGSGEPKPGVTAIVVKLVAASLREHPILNARVTATDVELIEQVNVAVAVDTPDGLVAPVVPQADRLSLTEIDALVADLASRARDNALRLEDVSGGTFTLSNGGTKPVDITTAILNPPQVGILWIGRIRDRPIVVDGAIAIRPTMQACLTFDHRAVDGAPAAEFLATFQSLVGALPELPA